MKNFTISLLALFALTAVAALGAGIDGKWTTDTGGKGAMTLTVKANGSALTGTMDNWLGAAPIIDGKITESDVSFKVVRSIPMRGKFTQTYTGKISGDELKLNISTDAPQRSGQAGERVFKRVK